MAELNFQNRTLYHGDNLGFLRGMNSGTVHLIATDPPFNKSKDFHATPDSLAAGASFQDRWSWRDDIHDDWLIQIQRDNPEVWHVVNAAKQVYGDDMGAFLCWLGVRLLEMHRVLRDDGTIYLHIDHTAHAYVKTLMDSVFGKRQFRNEIIWAYRGGVPKSDFARKHDTILRYSKTDKVTFNVDSVRIPYSEDSEERLRYTARSFRANRTYNNYSQNPQGKHPEDWWEMQPIMPSSKERTGFPTQKPLALYERIVLASSNPGDIVLDPFCGCATTPIVAELHGRQWVGVDIWDGAHGQVIQRMADNRQLLTEADPQVIYSTTPPTRTDRGETAALVLQTPIGRRQMRHAPPRSQHGRLLVDVGAFCQGCGRDYGFDPRVLEVDHIRPRADGGTDAYDNLTLLCPPCNKEKRDRLALSGLQDFNRRNGYLLAENEGNIRIGRATRRAGNRRGRRN